MKISTNAWHYNLIKTSPIFMDMPSNLCKYFWALMFAIFVKAAILIAIAIVLAFLVFVMFIVPITTLLYGVTGWTGVSGVTWLTFLVISIDCWLTETSLGEKFRENHSLFKSKNKKKTPNIFFEYIKAVKNKVCPIIEYEEYK